MTHHHPSKRGHRARCVWLGWLGVALALALSGCYAAFDWRTFSWPEGGFSVLLPDKPARESREVTIGQHRLRMDLFATRVEGASFGVGYAPLPPALDDAAREKLLADAREAFVRNVNAEAGEDRSISLDGFSGREFRASGNRDGRRLVVAGRVIATDQRFHQLIFIAPEDKAANVDVSLFLGSLKLLR